MFRSSISALIVRSSSARSGLLTGSRSIFSASHSHRNNAAFTSGKYTATLLQPSYKSKPLFNIVVQRSPASHQHRKLHYLAASSVAANTTAPIDANNTIASLGATPLPDTALQAADQIATTATQLTPYTWEYFNACTFFHVCIYRGYSYHANLLLTNCTETRDPL